MTRAFDPREEAARTFRQRFGHEAEATLEAPGRVNLIGEHTDYNDGFVMPMAIDRQVLMAVAGRRDRVVQLHALDFGAQTSFSLDDVRHDAEQRWSNYQRGRNGRDREQRRTCRLWTQLLGRDRGGSSHRLAASQRLPA